MRGPLARNIFIHEHLEMANVNFPAVSESLGDDVGNFCPWFFLRHHVAPLRKLKRGQVNFARWSKELTWHI